MPEANSKNSASVEARESFKQEAMKSWDDFQAFGRHLTGPEVRAWLNTWGDEPEASIPDCHK